MHHLTVMDDVLSELKGDEKGSIYSQRLQVTVNNSVRWKAGTVSLGNNSAYVTLSKKRMKELNVLFGDEITVTLEKDTSEFGFDVPEEFEELLRQDDEGNRRFRSLTMGKQRAIIYIVLQLKSSQKRIEKSIFLIENLKRAPEGKETMRHVLGKDLTD